jgi:hypothetical protein
LSLEQWSFVTGIGTLVVLTAAALVALGQLRHIRANNELSAFSEAFDLWYHERIQHGLRFIQCDLPQKMQDPAFRQSLDTSGPVDHSQHPELNVLDFFDNIGVYVVLGMMREDLVLLPGSQLIRSLWRTLSPTIAIMRRQRGASLYINFEYLAARAERWDATYPEGYARKGFVRLANADVWLERDAAADLDVRTPGG